MDTQKRKTDETHYAEVERSLALIGQVWESDVELSVDDMCEHLEAAINVIDRTSDFSQFVSESNLTGLERLN